LARIGEGEVWFEVFFDLIFAVAVAFWAEEVAHKPTLSEYLRSLAYLLPIWWIWVGDTVYATRFGDEVPRTRVLALVQVLCVGVMSTYLLEEGSSSMRFVLGYIGARISLLVMYAIAGRRDKRARAVAFVYALGFGCGAALWAASLLLPPRIQVIAWALGLGTDFSVPWFGRRILQQLPLDSRRLPDRVGTFTSLLLGVSVEGIVRGLAEGGSSRPHATIASLSFVTVMPLWWIYAARINQADFKNVLGSGQPYLYSHFPIVLGVGTSSVGIRVLQASRSTEESAQGLRLLAAGIVLWILGMMLVRRIVLRHRDRFWYTSFFGAALAAPLVALVGAGNPQLAVAALAGLVGALALAEQRHGARPHQGAVLPPLTAAENPSELSQS
jgi:low temperature requirement protein LtrA